MRGDARIRTTPQLIVGILILLFGVALTLDRLDIADLSFAFRFWPIVIVVVGGWLVLYAEDQNQRVWGWIWVGIGGLILLRTLARVSIFALFWPAVFIVVGVYIIRRTLSWPPVPAPSVPTAPGPSATGPAASGPAYSAVPPVDAGSPTGSAEGAVPPHRRMTIFAALGGSKRVVADSPFRGAEMTSIMGGCHLDLRQATIPAGEDAVIDLFAALGGSEIVVPAGWSVVSQVVTVLGGLEDKRLPEPAGESRPRLVLRGFVLMGGIVIRN